MSNSVERKNDSLSYTPLRVQNQKEHTQKLRKTTRNLDKVISNAKKYLNAICHNYSDQLVELESSSKQLEEDRVQVMIEFRAPSTSPSSNSGNYDEEQDGEVKDEIELGETSISVQSMPTTDDDPHNYQTVHGGSTAIKVEDEVDIKMEDEMEFCALSDIDQSISENDDEEPNNQTNLDGFTEIKVEGKIEFGSRSISVESISTIDEASNSSQTISDEFTETEDEMAFLDEWEVDALNTPLPKTTAAEKSGKPNVNKKKSEFTCDICSKQYSANSALKRHRKRHGKPNLYCHICNVAEFTVFDLGLHMKKHDTNPMFFTCDICPYKSSTKSNLKIHLMCHDTNRLYFTCDICPKKFSSEALLNLHRKRHPKRNFHCTVCDVTKVTKGEMDKHMTKHDANPKMFTCDICFKKCTSKPVLKKHRLRHGEPNFRCTFCSAAKFTKLELDLHMETHESNRIYFTCDICSSKFSRKGNLAAHMKRHDNMS